MTWGTFIVCANHTGNILDVPTRVIESIKNTKHIFCDHLDVFNRDILEPYAISSADKVIVETGNLAGEISSEVELGNLAVSILKNKENIVFITDSGLPGFADQGTKILDILYENGLNIEIIPGPSIFPAAIAIAGIPSHGAESHFFSFFDESSEEKHKKINKIKDFDATTVIIDYPEKIKELMGILKTTLGPGRLCAVCIDIGMPSQKVLRGTISDLNLKELLLKDCNVSVVVEGLSDSATFTRLVGSTGLEPVTDGL